MKLTEFLEDVGRPVAYYPSLARALGGVKQAVFLCQMIYWTGKGMDPDGWIYKTVEELEEETGLSYEEQLAARKTLVKSGVLEENYKRLAHQMNYRVNREALDELWENRISPSRESPFPDMAKTHMGKWQKPMSGNGQNPYRYTENTAETTNREFPIKTKSESGLVGAKPHGNAYLPVSTQPNQNSDDDPMDLSDEELFGGHS